MLSKTIADRLKGFETPFYLYDIDLLRRTLRACADESSRYGYRVHYAIKANYDPRILEEIRSFGLGIDAVSGNEVRRGIECGFPARDIVYAGVGKSDKEIRYSIEQDIFAFNCESFHELEIIDGIAADMGRKVRVALRINPDVDPKTHKYISTGQADSKFGISYTEIDRIRERMPQWKNIEIVGLHFHVGSQIVDLSVFAKLCERVNELWAWFADSGFRFSYVNVGGGLGINYGDPEGEPIPDFAGYFAVFREHLHLGPGVEVHFELGRSIVGQCGELISRVLFHKTTASGKRVAIVDASMTELLRPALYQARHAIENLSGGDKRETYIIGGTVCESSDIFARDLELPVLHRGDLVSLKSAGAYGAAMASTYNLHDLPGAVYSDRLTE
ncbi:MAG: diaminopimelate decarboxylase [Rikenellaceae bacterium]|nr:diaminopimelate decarboxylase [Rikenellaceae bacterium]